MTIPHGLQAVLLGVAGLATACGGDSTGTVTPPSPAPAAQPSPASTPAPAVTPKSASPTSNGSGPSLAVRKAQGSRVFQQVCFPCHQKDGKGLPGQFPPLAGSDYLLADVDRAIHGVIFGQQGEMVVNGTKWNLVMPPQGTLSDDDIANVLTYVLNSWGNKGDMVTPERVAAIRKAGAKG